MPILQCSALAAIVKLPRLIKSLHTPSKVSHACMSIAVIVMQHMLWGTELTKGTPGVLRGSLWLSAVCTTTPGARN